MKYDKIIALAKENGLKFYREQFSGLLALETDEVTFVEFVQKMMLLERQANAKICEELQLEDNTDCISCMQAILKRK